MNWLNFLLGLSGLVALVGNLAITVSGEGAEIDTKYRQLFARKGTKLTPDQTLEGLRDLAKILANEQDDESKRRLAEIEELIEYDNVTECDDQRALNLSHALFEYGFSRKTPSIKIYLKRCKTKLFNVCEPIFNEKAKQAVANLSEKPNFRELALFQSMIKAHTYRLPVLTFAKDIKGPLLNFMMDGLGVDLNSKMSEEEFVEKFNGSLMSLCEDVDDATKFMDHFTFFFTSVRLTVRMTKQLKDLYRMNVVCSSILAFPKLESHSLHESLTKRADSLWKRMFGSTGTDSVATSVPSSSQ